jgi:hypothetical protein
VREGAPTTPTVPAERRRRGGSWFSKIMGTAPRMPEETVASEPILRRLSEQELAVVDAVDLFNASQYRRTVGVVGAPSRTQPYSTAVSAQSGQTST